MACRDQHVTRCFLSISFSVVQVHGWSWGGFLILRSIFFSSLSNTKLLDGSAHSDMHWRRNILLVVFCISAFQLSYVLQLIITGTRVTLPSVCCVAGFTEFGFIQMLPRWGLGVQSQFSWVGRILPMVGFVLLCSADKAGCVTWLPPCHRIVLITECFPVDMSMQFIVACIYRTIIGHFLPLSLQYLHSKSLALTVWQRGQMLSDVWQKLLECECFPLGFLLWTTMRPPDCIFSPTSDARTT